VSATAQTAVPPGPLARTWAANKPLTFAGIAMAVTLVGTLIGILADPRVITGAPAWLKPAKFALSIMVYTFTLVWLLSFLPGRRRLVAIVSWTVTAALALEMVLIVYAAAAGTTSHFNVSTPAAAAIWSTMGSAIVAVWVANLAVGIALLRQRHADRAFIWSLRLGVLLALVGMALAFLMTSPTADQLAGAQAGTGMPVAGAHSVGVADGGPGLPFVGWSTVGGDLRVAHFFGLHALQLLPLFGYALSRWAPAWLRPGQRLALVWTVGLAYLGFVLITAWQALRGQPLLKPDALTLGALGVLVLATAVALVAATRRPAVTA
jgi:hypothetical protein